MTNRANCILLALVSLVAQPGAAQEPKPAEMAIEKVEPARAGLVLRAESLPALGGPPRPGIRAACAACPGGA